MNWIRRLPAFVLLALGGCLLMAAECPLFGSDGGHNDSHDVACDELLVSPLEVLAGPVVSTGEALHGTWSIDGEPILSVEIAAGVLPPGLEATVSDDQLIVDGAITEEGHWTPRLRVTDGCPAGTQTETLDLEFLALAPGNCPDILLEDYGPTILALDDYAQVILDLSGGFGTYHASLLSGTPPPGMAVSSYSPAVVGTPSEAGIFAFRVRVEDDCPDGSSALEADISLEVSADYCSPLVAESFYSTIGAVGEWFATDYWAGGGRRPLSFEVLDPEHLPPGIAQSTPLGSHFTGTPTTSGDYSFTVRTIDSCPNGPQVVEEQCTLTILPSDGACEPFAVLGISPETAVAGEDYLGTLVTTGGVAPFAAFWPHESLPAGLFVQTGTLALAGRPLFPGTYEIPFQVSDLCPYGQQTVAGQVTLTVLPADDGECPPLVYDDAALPLGILGQPYSFTLNVTGGEPPLTWSLTEFTAPGLSFSNGSLSGTPTQIGEFTLRCFVYDTCTPYHQNVYIDKPFVVGGFLRAEAQAASAGQR